MSLENLRAVQRKGTNLRNALICLMVAVAAYVLWIPAVSDQFDGPTVWVILTSAVCGLALLLAIAFGTCAAAAGARRLIAVMRSRR